MTTIILLCSRDFLLKQIFARLEHLICDREKTNLLVLVDGDTNLFLQARNLTVVSNFADKLCVKAKDYGRRSPSQSYRRKRIATLHNEVKQYIKPCKYILCLEDDGLFPINGLQKLLKRYAEYPHAGTIEGLELGRWQSRYIGAWIIDDPYEPTEISSIEYEPNTFIPIDAGGLYFCLTKYENYINHDFKPDLVRHWGPDIGFGLELRKQGLQNYIDTSIVLDHYSEKSGRIFNIKNDKPRVISLQKRGGTWRFITHVQNSLHT